MALFKLDDIPETFINQMNSFMDVMSRYNANAFEKQIMLLTCIQTEKRGIGLMKGMNREIRSKLKCDVFLNAEKLFEIQEPRYKKWISKYSFV